MKTNIVNFAISEDDDYAPEQADLAALATLIEKYAPHDGSFDLIPGVQVIKSSRTTPEGHHTTSSPGICIVPQGAKQVSLGPHDYEYDETRMIVYAAQVPIKTNIIKASKSEPYLCLVIQLDPQKLSELIMKVFPNGLQKTAESQAIYLGKSNPKIIKSSIRLIETIQQQDDVDLLAPLVIEEILIRLLRSPAGASIAQIGLIDSNTHKVARAISWLKDNYASPIKVEDMADIAGMSATSFHAHFKSITAMSPLQFQKALRLQEARNLMHTKMMDVSTASLEVGYASVSQFSREYTRHFGMPPSKDIARLI